MLSMYERRSDIIFHIYHIFVPNIVSIRSEMQRLWPWISDLGLILGEDILFFSQLSTFVSAEYIFLRVKNYFDLALSP